MRNDAPSPWLARGVYLLAFTLVFWPMADFATNVWPIRPGDVQWRYGVGGLLASFLHTPMLGLALAALVAWRLQQPKALKTLAAVQALLAAALLAVMALFALDALQVRATRPDEMLPAFGAGALIAEAKHLTAAVTLAVLALGCWGSAARLTQEEGAAPKGGARVIVQPKGPRGP